MAGSVSEDNGVGRSSEGISNGQHCQSGEVLAEWRSCEQVENGTPSTSPAYWDTDDDDDCGPKPSELYGKFTWKIENFEQISKRELRSNAFEVGGYKWYILIYPQGCDVCNHLSLFLCVANHDKLLPGWSHFAQFTIAVVNKDPKKSKYSDTLHRFCKKEHDWGWKKFMELSKVQDGFIVSDTLVIKAQVQVISFCSFWLGVGQNARCHVSREKTDVILKVVVRHFFIEKEVTSTLVMDSLYSGLKALECQSKSKEGRAKFVDTEEMPTPIVHVEKDSFVLADDVLLLLERAALEPLPPKDEKGPQNRTKDGSSGEDFNKDSIERDERRLTELGRRTLEIFVLAHIFSNRIEVAYQEAVAFKRQEELIREEEAAGQAESEQKAKRGATEKEKRSKKKQRRSSRKGKDRGRDEKSDVTVHDEHQRESPTDEGTVDDFSKQAQPVLEKPDALEDVSDVSDTQDVETLQPDLEERDASPVNWDTDTSEVHPATEASSSEMSVLCLQNGQAEKKSSSVMDDSSSTCSTDSVPSVVMNGPYKGNSLPNYRSRTLTSRGKNQRGKEIRDRTSWVHDTDNQPFDPALDAGRLTDASGSCMEAEPESEAVRSLKDRIQWPEQNRVEKEEVVSLQRKLSVKDQVDIERPCNQRMASEVSSPSSPNRNPPSPVQPLSASESTATAESVSVRETFLSSPRQAEKAVPPMTRVPQIPALSHLVAQKPATPKPTFMRTDKPTAHQVPVISRPSSAPLIPVPRPTAPVISMVQTTPSLARSVSAFERLGTDPSQETHSYVPQSYRNAIMGKTIGASLAGFVPHHSSSSVVNPLRAYSEPPSASVSSPMLSPQSSTRTDQSSVGSGFSFGRVTPEILHNQPQWITDCSRLDANGKPCEPSLLNGIQNLNLYGAGNSRSLTYFADEYPASVSGRQTQGVSADEFPHLDIINYLFDEEHSIGRTAKVSAVFQSPSNGHHHALNRQFTFPGDRGMSAEMNPSSNYYMFNQLPSYHEDGMQQVYGSSSGHFDGLRDVIPQVCLSAYANGQIDGVIQNQWLVGGADLSLLSMRNGEGDGYRFQIPDYPNLEEPKEESDDDMGFSLFD
ncbi:hypothetical protein HHK36_020517 [Tetracentron sinense]|uniref:MATH domain-containing protein n=2 Tax=Magnoliopsida TaxID=3398 RepID=A0A834YU61_TETSI|nr:hypothetical protein HHK36_020517 [Tetracentron sinense]